MFFRRLSKDCAFLCPLVSEGRQLSSSFLSNSHTSDLKKRNSDANLPESKRLDPEEDTLSDPLSHLLERLVRPADVQHEVSEQGTRVCRLLYKKAKNLVYVDPRVFGEVPCFSTTYVLCDATA